jgi:phosphoglycerate dehydrogenase-like enzyme
MTTNLASPIEKTAVRAPACTQRIVFALTEESKSHYLPLFAEAGFPIAGYDWIDISSRDKTAWEKSLVEINPTLLVTGWGTPAMPESYAQSSCLGLRYVCHLAGSVKPMVPRSLLKRGVLVSNWGTTISHTVAEHAMLLVLGALRNLPAWKDYLDHWKDRVTPFAVYMLQTRSLRGRRVGIHGFGAVARELVEMLKPFQVEIASYSHGVPRELFKQHGVRCCDSLEELFSQSEIVIECEALTPLSRGSITEKVLRLLPEGAVFINVARGMIVDEAALSRVAGEGYLRVGLDVYRQEPLPDSSRLLAIQEALLSPHIAGPTVDSFPLIARFAARNIRAFLDGTPVDGVVTLEAYDRST